MELGQQDFQSVVCVCSVFFLLLLLFFSVCLTVFNPIPVRSLWQGVELNPYPVLS